MIPRVIDDQQATECLGILLAPISAGKLDKPVHVHAACLLMDYGMERVLAHWPAPQPPKWADLAFNDHLAACHARREPHTISWGSLLPVLSGLVEARMPGGKELA